MTSRTLNLGIVAHVDAGKTTLTERLLFAAGVIDEFGSVDAGTTKTDSLDLERRRGITIRSAVVSFEIAGTRVNLIDTPGHPDFIAEVERVLSVLDGAVLVLSAVEGVQPQTRVLMRALRRLRIPTLLFVNKIDRRGADPERVLEAIDRRLSPGTVAMGSVSDPGTRAARFTPLSADDAAFRTRLGEVLADGDDALLAAYVEDEQALTWGRLHEELRRQTTHGLVRPVFLGSAITGAGVESLTTGLVELLPSAGGDPDGQVSARIFKVERGPSGEKVAYLRMLSGTLRTRDRLPSDHHDTKEPDDKVTAIRVDEHGAWVHGECVRAGQIAQVWGLRRIRVGDTVGAVERAGNQFAPPTLETVVVPVRAADKGRLLTALAQLAEQDPLINVRQDDLHQEISVSLYGEVQKEVIQATLADDFGVDVTFVETTTLCVERPAGRGHAVEVLHGEDNPFLATIGLRVEPRPDDAGVEFAVDVESRAMPLYVFRNSDAFTEVMGRHVREALHEGLHGWPVTDCLVTLTECGYSSPDGPPSTRGPLSSPADFRKLTPLVVMRALEEARTTVCEPIVSATLEVPAETTGPVLAELARLGAAVRNQSTRGDLTVVETQLPAARVPLVQRRLPGLTSGEGVLESAFAGYASVSGEPPARRRTTVDPRDRRHYLRSVRA